MRRLAGPRTNAGAVVGGSPNVGCPVERPPTSAVRDLPRRWQTTRNRAVLGRFESTVADSSQFTGVQEPACAPRRRWLVAGVVALMLVAFAIPPVHDCWVTNRENSVDEAMWKWLFWGDTGLPEGWHRNVPGSLDTPQAWARDVTRVGGDVFTVNGWVERLDDRGDHERRACTWWLWREGFDVWHLTRISIDGDVSIELDEIDGPTGKCSSLWCTRIERALGPRDSAP